jgi:hypothetical protein
MPKTKNVLRLPGIGSKHYLDFLRNLTPQILLFAFVLMVGRKLNFNKLDFANSLPTLLFYVLLVAFCFAVWGNCNQLLKGCYPDMLKWTRRISVKAVATRRTGLIRLWFLIVASIRMRLLVILELFFVILLLQIVLAVTIVASITSAVSFIKMGA